MTITSTREKLKQILSARQTGVVVIVSGIIGRLIQIVYFFDIRVDASYQTIATKNFVEGHGISIDSVLPSDLSTIIYEPLIKWPPGFSLLLSPFYVLSGGNYIIAGILFHGISAIALILFSRAILGLLEAPLFLINAYTIVVSFVIYSFYFIFSSDAIETSFFIAAVYYILSFLKTQQHSVKKIGIASACLLICAFIKYLLIAVVFVVPAYFLTKGFFTNDRKLKKGGFISFSILFVGIASLLLYQKNVSGAAAYVSEPAGGFSPQNLLDAYPLFPAALLNPDTFGLLTNNAAAPSFIFRLYQLIYLPAIAFLIFGVSGFVKSLRQEIPLKKAYFYLSVFAFIALFGVLAILSLFIAKGEESPGRWWTYVQEPRYYGPLVVLMQLALFIYYAAAKHKAKTLLYFLFLLLAVETTRGIIFSLNRIQLFNKEEYGWHYEDRFQKYADSILQTAEKKFSVKNAVVTGSSYYMNNRVCLYSRVPALSNASMINQPSVLQTKRPVLLLAIIRKNDFPAFQSFISEQKEIAGKFDDFYFYTVYVQPH